MSYVFIIQSRELEAQRFYPIHVICISYDECYHHDYITLLLVHRCYQITWPFAGTAFVFTNDGGEISNKA